jgi:phosphoglycolate phosphatase
LPCEPSEYLIPGPLVPAAVNALLLDVDGTLLETFPDILDSMNRALAEVGEAPLRGVELRPLIGIHVVRQMAILRKMPEARARAVNDRYYEHFRRLVEERVRVYPGVADTMPKLAGRPMATFTTRRREVARIMLRTAGLDRRFTAIVGGDEVVRQKPAPDLALHVAGVLGVPPSECVVVGDAPVDIEAGNAAGMRTVAATYGYGNLDSLRAARPTREVASFAELPAVLAAMGD